MQSIYSAGLGICIRYNDDDAFFSHISFIIWFFHVFYFLSLSAVKGISIVGHRHGYVRSHVPSLLLLSRYLDVIFRW